jgi:hydrogenase nickel incorporation protein HypA/HybF
MHELSLCHHVLTTVDRARRGRAVQTVHLQIGQRRQVISEDLKFYWELVTEPSQLAGSELAIDHVPVEVMCHVCSAGTLAGDALLPVCGECGSGHVLVVAGEEFWVTMLELRDRTELIEQA